MKVFIMRGVPGCGKTSWCKDYHTLMNPGTYPVYCSADTFMVDVEGQYDFKVERLPEVHDKCMKLYVDLMKADPRTFQTVFVDNTNLRMYEIAPYYRLAEAAGHEVVIVQFLVDPAVAAARNVHGVPADKVLQMAATMDPLPPWWKVRYVAPKES